MGRAAGGVQTIHSLIIVVCHPNVRSKLDLKQERGGGFQITYNLF